MNELSFATQRVGKLRWLKDRRICRCLCKVVGRFCFAFVQDVAGPISTSVKPKPSADCMVHFTTDARSIFGMAGCLWNQHTSSIMGVLAWVFGTVASIVGLCTAKKIRKWWNRNWAIEAMSSQDCALQLPNGGLLFKDTQVLYLSSEKKVDICTIINIYADGWGGGNVTLESDFRKRILSLEEIARKQDAFQKVFQHGKIATFDMLEVAAEKYFFDNVGDEELIPLESYTGMNEGGGLYFLTGSDGKHKGVYSHRPRRWIDSFQRIDQPILPNDWADVGGAFAQGSATHPVPS